MIGTLMIYCLSVAALVSVAAFVVERAFGTLGWARRTVWIAGMMASICLPLLMMSVQDSTENFAAPILEAQIVADFAVPSDATNAPSLNPSYLHAINSVLEIAWPVLSIGCIAFAFVGWLRLRQAARAWQRKFVDDTHVRVSHDMGPAVVGFVNPEIVVPRWLLTASPADRIAAIAHERSHISAGDPVLLLMALLMVAAMPWNIPMWWQLRRLRFAIEVDCDQRVLRSGTSIETYGEMLLAVGQRSQTAMSLGAIALIEPVSQLERRIRIMTTDKYRYATLLVVASLALSTSLVAVATQLEAPSLATIVPASMSASAISTKTVPIDDAREKPAPVESKVIVKPAAALISTKQLASPEARKPPVLAPAKKSKSDMIVIAESNKTGAVNASSIVLSEKTAVVEPPANRPIKRLKTVPPIYPVEALKDSPNGWVEVAYAINTKGAVVEAHVINSEPATVFDEAALEAVRQWQFEPALRDGQPIVTPSKVRVKFSSPNPSYGSNAPKAEITRTEHGLNTKSETLNLKFQGIDVRTVLKLLSDTSGKNILVSDKVAGTVSIDLHNAPWQQALDEVCNQAGLKQRLSGNVILIEPK